MREELIGIDTPTHTLATSIAFAKYEVNNKGIDESVWGSSPRGVIVMFAGSGPIDRNENLPRFSLNIFNALAQQFSEAGFASVRYDKRGCGASGGDYITAGHSDLVADAIVVTQFVHQHEAFKDTPIYLLGHSEGTVIAPQVAEYLDEHSAGQVTEYSAEHSAENLAEHEPKDAAKKINIAGLMLLCPFSRPMREVLLEQAVNRTEELNAMTGVIGALSKAFVKMRGGYMGIQSKFLKRIEGSSADTVNMGKATVNAKWYREMLALDPVALWQTVKVPTFALGGGKDLQCHPDDTHALTQHITQADVTVHVEKNMTHILRCDDGVAAIGRYPKLVKEPIDPLVGERCIDWLTQIA